MKYYFLLPLILTIVVMLCSACILKPEVTITDSQQSIDDSTGISNQNAVVKDTDIPDVDLLTAKDIEYLGSFRLPGNGDRPGCSNYYKYHK